MAADTDALGGAIDPVIDGAMNQNFSMVHNLSLQHYQDGVQMARKAYARLEGAFDYFSAQAEATFLQGITNMDLAQQILGSRQAEAQPQQNNTPGWAGGPAAQSMLPSKVTAAGAAG